MPPLVPASTNSRPFASSAFARRIESRKFELPPSMMMSPPARWGAHLAPSCTCVWMTSALRSYTTTSCPPWSSRRTMLPPMRPNPIIASCIAAPPSSGHGHRREIAAESWGVYVENGVHAESPRRLEVGLAVVDEHGGGRLRLRHHQRALVDLGLGLEHPHPARREECGEDVSQAERL